MPTTIQYYIAPDHALASRDGLPWIRITLAELESGLTLAHSLLIPTHRITKDPSKQIVPNAASGLHDTASYTSNRHQHYRTL